MYTVLAKQRAHEEAEILLRKGLKIAPSDRLSFRLAQVLMELERYDEATEVVKMFLREQPDSPLAYIALADLHWCLEHDEKVSDDLERALARKTSRSWILFEAGKRYVQMPSNRERGIELLLEFSRQMPNEPLPHAMLAGLLKERDPAASRYHRGRADELYGADTNLRDEALTHFSEELP
jgi:predicted Zn-dependent protease